MARELAPKNIHVSHIVIDGAIASSYAKPEDAGKDRWPDSGRFPGQVLLSPPA